MADVFFYYASFPNSRNKLRSPTVNANTYHVTVADNTSPLTLVAPSNLNRTYIILTNSSDAITMRYLYASVTVVDPSAIATFGVTDQLLYNPNINTLYQKQDDGTNMHWVIVAATDVAEYVLPFQSASLETLGDIYAFADDPASGLVIAVDEGRG